ncbi:MAG: TonB-dependent receptor [Mariprofundaceae bacterium]
MTKQIKFVVVVMLGMPLIAHAQEDLGTINVTATRTQAPSITSSRAVTIIDRQTIEGSHAGNVVDLLKGQANIVVSDITGVGAKSRVDLGGYGETAAANSIVLIDGRRVNSPDLSGVDWSQIPVDQIERIEIVHGGGSVLYGDGAVGGVINIITRIPESGGNISLSGGSFGTFEGAGRIGADAGKVRVETNFSGTTTDGYRDNSFFDRFDGGVRAEADLPANISLNISGNHHRDRAGLPGALTAAQIIVDRRQAANPQDFSRSTDDFIDGGLVWSGISGLTLDLAGGFRRRDVHSEFFGFFSSNSDFVQQNRSFRPKLSYAAGNDVRWHLVTGADIDRGDGSFVFGGAFPLPTTFFDRKRDGYYGLVEAGSADHRWHVSGGVRTEKVEDIFTQTATNSVSQRETVWESGISFGITEQLRLRLNAASSVRFPLLDERFDFFTGAVNTSLLAQTGQHYAISLRQDWNRVWLEASLSRADLDHEIFFNPLAFANENYADPTRHDVIAVSGHWRAHDRAILSANYAYTKATFHGGVFSGNEIPAVAKNRVGASWLADWGHGFSTTLNLTYVGQSFLISDQANARSQLPSYLVLDAVASYRWKDMEIFARIDNLTNKKYSSYGVFSSFSGTDNFYPSPEIGVRAGAGYRF